jgi:carbonic anhydrase/acetyltransferase-like protein (isoleucine patch superfamily)
MHDPRFPGATILPFGGKVPRIHDSAFIAPGARVIGDVEVGADASVWYNCVLRGDINRIVLGARSNVQDGTVIHVEGPRPESSMPTDGLPTLIGEDCLIGHSAILHGCVLEDRAFVGMDAVAMDGARVGSGAMLGAGALLSPGKAIPAGEVWIGRPAKFLRAQGPEQEAKIAFQCQRYVDLARRHKAAILGAGISGTPEG